MVIHRAPFGAPALEGVNGERKLAICGAWVDRCWCVPNLRSNRKGQARSPLSTSDADRTGDALDNAEDASFAGRRGRAHRSPSPSGEFIGREHIAVAGLFKRKHALANGVDDLALRRITHLFVVTGGRFAAFERGPSRSICICHPDDASYRRHSNIHLNSAAYRHSFPILFSNKYQQSRTESPYRARLSYG